MDLILPNTGFSVPSDFLQVTFYLMGVKYLNSPTDARAMGDVAIYNFQLGLPLLLAGLSPSPCLGFACVLQKEKEEVDSRI